MNHVGRLFACLTLAAFTALPAAAQVDDLMAREIDEALFDARWRAGPFRLTPVLRIGGGSDSNPLSQPGSGESEDLTLVAGPGVRAVVPMGNRGLVDAYQENGYIYFRDLENLRNFYNISRVRGALGGRDFIVHGRAGYTTGQVRPSSELDLPLDQTERTLGGEIDIALGSAQQLNFIYDRTRLRYQDPEAGGIGVSVPNLLDRTEQAFKAQIERYLTPRASVVLEGSYDLIDYVDNSTERDGKSVEGRAGIIFSARSNVRGQAMFGFKQLTPDVPTQAEFSGFVASADIIYPLRERIRLRGLGSRNALPSILPGNWFFVENRFGGSVDVYLANRWFIRPGVTVGTNTYPRPSSFVDANGNPVTDNVSDEFRLYSFSINYEIRPDLFLRAGIDALRRSSNLPQFSKDRNVITVGLTTDF